MHKSIQNTHRGYIAIELLMAIVVLGVGFGLFYEVYTQRHRHDAFTHHDLYQAQKSMEQAIIVGANKSDFSIKSKNGYVYQGVLIQSFERDISYKYFVPNVVLGGSN